MAGSIFALRVLLNREHAVAESDEWQRQLVDLQSQVAFQEDALQALNDALAEQQREILMLRRQVELLKQRQDEQAAQLDDAGSPVDEKPPHY